MTRVRLAKLLQRVFRHVNTKTAELDSDESDIASDIALAVFRKAKIS